VNLRVALEQALATEARLAEERREAYDKDPGNTGIAHNIFNAWGYHDAFQAWERARNKRMDIERELGVKS
jgi:hypothetical protein